ncbi:MAG: substrate-binding domain-containing protein [Verrucomicrobia bacterium]|nr:substrate-binding domain-containing protein [Verrucomicrobiota bacterium]
MNRTSLIPLCLIACCGLAFSALPAAAKTEKVVLSVPNMAFPFFAFMRDQANDEAKKQDLQLALQDGQGSSPKQSSDLRNAVTQGVDGIVLVPNDIHALVPVVNEVTQSNIPLVTVDRRVTGTAKPVPHVGADNVAGGRAQGEWVLKKFPDGAKILFLRGEPGSSPAIDRAKGFYDVIKAAGDKYKVLADQTANFHRDQGMTVTQNLLTSLGSPPDVIVSSNDDMALGAVSALQQSRVPKGKVAVIGYDALPEALRAIRNGDMSATVEQSPGKQVRTALDELADYMRGKKPMQDVSIPPFVVDDANLDKAERIAEAK